MLDGDRLAMTRERPGRGVRRASRADQLFIIAAFHPVVIGSAGQIVAERLPHPTRRWINARRTPGQQSGRRQEGRGQAVGDGHREETPGKKRQETAEKEERRE